MIQIFDAKQGIDLIATERQEQIEKHNRDIDYDLRHNSLNQLATAAGVLCVSDLNSRGRDVIMENKPIGWHPGIWEKMCAKDKMERLIIAGALIAAEIDRMLASSNSD